MTSNFSESEVLIHGDQCIAARNCRLMLH